MTKLLLRTGALAALALLALPRPADPIAAAQTLPLPSGEQVTIIRDRFGVPHVFAETPEGMSFGAGYAVAQDCLWEMEVFRRIAKGQLSDLIGPSELDMDKEVRFFTYTADERARKFATYSQEVQRGIRAFVDGVNAWVLSARLPENTPLEFALLGIPITDWTVDDTIALEDVLILAFGSGGGNELANAALLDFLVRKYGQGAGLKAFKDVVWINDPASPPSIPRDFNWQRSPTFARPEADSDFKLNLYLTDARLSLGDSAKDAGPASVSTSGSVPTTEDQALLAQLALVPDFGPVQEALDHLERVDALRAAITFGSNAQIVGPSLAEAGNSLETAGPQVGHSVPQFLVDFGLHGGGVDTVGMTFAGAGPAVLIGRGLGYAWTTTTGDSDLTDTYVETLNPANPRQYLFRDRWENMNCRTEVYTFRGVPIDAQEICRTRHGPILAFDEAHHVAYSLRYSWFNAEKGTVEGFFGFNAVRSLEDFATFANFLTSNHNMLYIDDRGDFGYWHPGAHPIRQPFVDLRLPQDGTGASEWRGIRVAQDVPHAANFPRAWLANWNNKPSVDWDREFGWGAVHKVQDIFNVLDPTQPRRLDPEGATINPDGKLSWDDLNSNLRYVAFREHNADVFLPFLPAAARDAQEASALAEVRSWDRFLMDRDADCRWDAAGATIFGRWLDNLRSLAFDDDLGPFAGQATTSMLLHVLQGNRAALKPHFDWLAGETAAQLATRTFHLTVVQLAAEFGNPDPAGWKGRASYQHYTRLNADLLADAVRERPCPYPGSASPGDIPDHVAMDRGTYNHIVAYVDPPAASGPLGQSRDRSASVIPPGQSGFINLAGMESPPGYPTPRSPGGHYRDQFGLYVNWQYKPMPLRQADVESQGESVEVITLP